MNTTITIVFLSIAALACGWVYTYLAWAPFFTYVGTRKNFADIPKVSLLRFLISGFLVIVCATMIFFSLIEGALTLFLLMPAMAIISVFAAMVFFFIKWRKASDPLDVTLEQHFRKIWPDLVPFSVSEVDLKRFPKMANIEKRIRKNEHNISEFWFVRQDLRLEDVRVAYNSYLDGLGHKMLRSHDPDSRNRHYMRIFETTDGDAQYFHIVQSGISNLYHVYGEVLE